MSIATQVFRGYGAGGNIDTRVRRGFAAYTGLPQPPSLGQYQTCGTPYSGSGFWLGDGSTPAVLTGDVFATPLTVSPGNYAIQINADGTIEVFVGGDNSRQSALYEIYRLASNTLDGPAVLYINEVAPIWTLGPVPGPFTVGQPMTPFNFVTAGYVASPSGDTLTIAVNSGAPPNGTTIDSTGEWSGLPLLAGTYQYTLSATDQAGFPSVSPLITVGVSTAPVPVPPFVLYGKNIPKARPVRRTIDERALVYGMSGPEQPYPVYQFSGYRLKWERPGHNPFAGL